MIFVTDQALAEINRIEQELEPRLLYEVGQAVLNGAPLEWCIHGAPLGYVSGQKRWCWGWEQGMTPCQFESQIRVRLEP